MEGFLLISDRQDESHRVSCLFSFLHEYLVERGFDEVFRFCRKIRPDVIQESDKILNEANTLILTARTRGCPWFSPTEPGARWVHAETRTPKGAIWKWFDLWCEAMDGVAA